MATAVLRYGHARSVIHMPTPEYQREHGTQVPIIRLRAEYITLL